MSTDSTTLKRCSKCHRELPAITEYFPTRADSKDGLRGQCRECTHARRIQYYEDNHEKALAYTKQWEKENTERAKENNRRWARKNREHINERNRELRRLYPERHREYSRKSYIKHREQKAEYGRRWVENNRDKTRASVQRYYASNPETIKAIKHRRRAREAGNGGSFTPADLVAIRAAQTDKKGRLICWKCGKPIKGTPHLDHWIPLGKQGLNSPGNLHYMHARCNLEKGAKLPTEIGRLL